MSDLNWNKVEAIIDRAMDLPEGERKLFIEEQCGDNLKLKGEVTLLLESIFDSEGWLEDPADYKKEFYEEISDDVELLAAGQPLIGKQVGSYTIKEKIGEGGMGVVYRAERSDEEFAHRVAIKIIRHERATRENIRRFKHEQRILAGLNHPGIARLFDGGVTGDGFPYIIMEYVDGTPIDDYCHQQSCTLDHKIELFENVLEAVRYAHENLVIHRDLKPGNILVDQDGNIKILDFGISKLLEDEDDMELTQTGARLLTPHYAAPEQVKQQNITTATDLYALGIIFYQLLAGKHPFDFEELSRYEMEQAILEQEAPRPSAKISSPKLQKKLQGDLDAIALKAIRKESDKRYRVANEFLDDLKNYQTGLPVSAREDSFKYRSQKFFKRHKPGIAIAMGVLFLIIGFAGFYTWRIAQERDQAQLETQKAQNVKELLIDIFEANDPISGDAETASLPKLLENGTTKILNRDIEPSVKLELLFTLGTIYQNITEFDKARQLAQESLRLSNKYFGALSVYSAKSYIKLAGIDYDLGNYEEGKKDVVKAKNILNGQHPESNPVYSELYNHFGFIEEAMSNYDSSRVYFQKSLDNIKKQSPIDSAKYVNVLASVGRSVHRTGNYKKADSLMFVALKTSERFHGENDAVTASIAGDIGMYYMTRAKYDSSRIYYNRSLDIKEKIYGEKGHPNYSATLINLGVLEAYTGNNEVAEPLFIKALKIDTKLFGENHPYIAITKGHLASIYMEWGELSRAKGLMEEQLQVYLDSYGPEHYYLAGFYRNYGKLFFSLKEYERAEIQFEKAEQIYTKFETTPNTNFAKLYEARGENFYKMKKFKAAINPLEEAAKFFNPSKYDKYKIRGAKCLIKAGQSYTALNQLEKAEKIFREIKVRIDTTKPLTNNSELLELYSMARDNLEKKQ
jgi:serine/threonine-protein kinase